MKQNPYNKRLNVIMFKSLLWKRKMHTGLIWPYWLIWNFTRFNLYTLFYTYLQHIKKNL